jgi:hypothetical protein
VAVSDRASVEAAGGGDEVLDSAAAAACVAPHDSAFADVVGEAFDVGPFDLVQALGTLRLGDVVPVGAVGAAAARAGGRFDDGQVFGEGRHWWPVGWGVDEVGGGDAEPGQEQPCRIEFGRPGRGRVLYSCGFTAEQPLVEIGRHRVDQCRRVHDEYPPVGLGPEEDPAARDDPAHAAGSDRELDVAGSVDLEDTLRVGADEQKAGSFADRQPDVGRPAERAVQDPVGDAAPAIDRGDAVEGGAAAPPRKVRQR